MSSEVKVWGGSTFDFHGKLTFVFGEYVLYELLWRVCPVRLYPFCINSSHPSFFSSSFFLNHRIGGCDLTMLHSPNFGNGIGMDIHIRTKIKNWWSYIESAVVRIGQNTFEVRGGTPTESDSRYWINGLPGSVNMMDEMDKLEHLEDMSGHSIQYKVLSSKKRKFRIDLGHGNAVGFESYADFVRVNVRAKNGTDFEGSTGLMGSFPYGEMIGRYKSDIIEDPNEFGKQWQVLPSEGQLFHNIEGVQAPEECAMPDESIKNSRRLGESMISKEDAALACAHVNGDEMDRCIFDVMATNEKDIAGAY